jgi:gluconate 2-dehydrogenase gamma chain
MNRREFLILTTGFAVTPGLAAKPLPAVTFTPDKRIGLDSHHWQVVDRALDHLFPSESDAPGARDVYATAWLHNALLMPDIDPDHREFMRNGALQLEETSLTLEKHSFIKLDAAQREAVLRNLEQQPNGEAWLRETLRYILEAMLSDPVYGGNPGAIGWKWLQHQPGFPRPPKNKRYFLL